MLPGAADGSGAFDYVCGVEVLDYSGLADQIDRVRIPAGSRNEAVSLCESYKSAGGNPGGVIPNPAIRNLIREKKIYQIDLVIETSLQEGMITLNRSMANLVKEKQISLENAELYSSNPSELRILLERM